MSCWELRLLGSPRPTVVCNRCSKRVLLDGIGKSFAHFYHVAMLFNCTTVSSSAFLFKFFMVNTFRWSKKILAVSSHVAEMLCSPVAAAALLGHQVHQDPTSIAGLHHADRHIISFLCIDDFEYCLNLLLTVLFTVYSISGILLYPFFKVCINEWSGQTMQEISIVVVLPWAAFVCSQIDLDLLGLMVALLFRCLGANDCLHRWALHGAALIQFQDVTSSWRVQ